MGIRMLLRFLPCIRTIVRYGQAQTIATLSLPLSILYTIKGERFFQEGPGHSPGRGRAH